MKKKNVKIIILLTWIFILLIIIPKDTQAAGLTLSASNTKPEVGSNISLTIGSGIGGKVSIKSSNPNVISVPSTIFIDYNSTTINLSAKQVGTTNITVTAVDVVTTDAEPKEIKGSKTITISVNEKKEQVDSSNDNQSQSNNNSSSKKTPASNKSNTNKEKVKDMKQTEQQEEATPQFGINSLMINAIKENGEKQEITFTPTFNIDTYEYYCEIENDVNDIEILTEAGEYNEYVKIEKPESLIVGENIVKITMEKDGQNLTYTIKINKKEAQQESTEETEQGVEENSKKGSNIVLNFSLLEFIGIILAICIIEGVLLKMPWKKLFSINKKGKIEEDKKD